MSSLIFLFAQNICCKYSLQKKKVRKKEKRKKKKVKKGGQEKEEGMEGDRNKSFVAALVSVGRWARHRSSCAGRQRRLC